MPIHRLQAAPFLAIALAVAGCGDSGRGAAEAGDVGGTVIISTAADADYLLPPIITNVQGKAVSDLIFDHLAEIGDEMNTLGDRGFEPRLARSWSWAADSLSIAFNLDPAARWHDGTPVRAADVRMGFELMRDPRVASAQAANVADIDSVTVRDSLTAVVWYGQRSLDQFFTAAYNIIPLPEHLLRDAKRQDLASTAFARAPVGSGRFRFVRWLPGQLIELVADTSHHRGRARLDRVVFSISPQPAAAVARLFAGEADFFEVLRGEQVGQAERSDIVKLAPYGGVDFAYLQFNFREPGRRGEPHRLFADRALRRALLMSLDREAIVRNVYDTLASVPLGPAPRSLGLVDESIRQLPFDTTAARRTLDSLGWRDADGDGIRERRGTPLRFGVMVPSSSVPRQRAAVLLQEQFKRVGVDLRIEQLDFNALIARLNTRNFDAVMNASHADPSPATIRQSWTTAAARAEGGSNYGSFEHARFDAFVDSAVASRDVEESRRLYKAAYQAFVDEVPVILLYEPKLVAGVHRRVRVAGMRPDAWWAGIGEWSIPAAERIERDRIGLRPAAQ